jgi:MFS transporter, FHS family, Na+ dependent glucose transporter 1
VTRTKRPPAGWLYLVSFVAVGLSLTLLGPALTHLREVTGSDKGEIAILFVTSSLGYLVGSLVSGRLYDKGFGHKAVAGGLIGLAVGELAIPHMSTVNGLAVVVALIGAFSACVDVGGNTLVVWLSRGNGSARLLNALHMCFGIGALLCPLLVNRSLVLTDGLGLAVGFIAVYSLIVAVLMLLHEAPTHTVDEAEEAISRIHIPARILLIVSFFFFLYVGVEIGFSQWLKTYAEGIELPGKDSPTYLNTLFFVCFTFGRFLAFVMAKRIRSGPMLFGSCLLTSLFVLVMALANGSPPVVWTMTALIGLTLAPQFATMIAYTEDHISLTGQATSWFISAAGLGGMALPYLIGQMLDESSGAMPIVVFGGSVAATGWLLVVRTALINHRGVPAELVHQPV